MILKDQNTTVAFRCPSCGKAILSGINIFRVSADMLRLRCPDCGEVLTLTTTNDGKLRLTVPCVICPHPHQLVIGKNTFFCEDLFTFPCPLSGVDILFAGDQEKVEQALKKNEEDLRKMTEGLEPEELGAWRRKDPDPLPDPAVEHVVRFLLCELEEEGKISCYCKEEGEIPLYDFQVLSERVRIFCHCCNAETYLPLRSEADAERFIRLDSLTLK